MDAFVEGDAREYARLTTTNTTGQRTWPAARALASYLDASDALAGARDVLELGSGSGWLGLAVLRARGARDVRVTMTETADGGALRWLEARVRANAAWGRATGDDGTTRARCRALDWRAFAAASDARDARVDDDDDARVDDDDGDGARARAGADATAAADEDDARSLSPNSPELADVDVVLGADLVYDDAGVVALPRVVAAVLARARGGGGVLLRAHEAPVRRDGFGLLRERRRARADVRGGSRARRRDAAAEPAAVRVVVSRPARRRVSHRARVARGGSRAVVARRRRADVVGTRHSMARVARVAPPRAAVARRAGGARARARVRASRATAVDDDARFGRRRDALALGDVVEVRLARRPGARADDAATAVGEISDFVTNSSFHADGIKVRLKSGEIGRVTRARWDDDDDDDDAEEVDEDEDEDEDARRTSSSATTTSDGGERAGEALRTAYVSGVSKSSAAADVKALASGLPGVKNVRVPVRGGSHMGYMFIECADGDGMRGVIEALHGREFHGKALVAERAKEDPKPKKKKPKTDAASAKPKTKKTKTRAELEAEAAARRIIDARAQMEADALLELERAKRRRERELEVRERELEVQRALDLDRERRARNLLERRAAAAQARAERARAAADARAAALAAARELGDVRVDPSWRPRADALRETLARLRVDADDGRDARS